MENHNPFRYRIRKATSNIVREKKDLMFSEKKCLLDDDDKWSLDLLSRFLESGHSEEKFVIDIVIIFILEGRDTTLAALTWFFWLIYYSPRIEKEVLKEINNDKSVETTTSAYVEVKEMVYTHAALCESVRLYPPVPVDNKEAASDDVLPEGTVVKKGEKVAYHPYSMGRFSTLWGEDWEEYRPERWLDWEMETKKWRFVGKDPYTYPLFQAGPRICLGVGNGFLADEKGRCRCSAPVPSGAGDA